MRGILSFAVVLIASVSLITAADAAKTKKKRPAKAQWKGYGFLPGYAPYEDAKARKKGRRGQVNRYGYGGSPFTYTNPPLQVYAGYPYYGGYPYGAYGYPYGAYGGYYGYGRSYYVGKYYYGAPGFVRGQYNGGSMGPCWTQTPIGPIWNCGR